MTTNLYVEMTECANVQMYVWCTVHSLNVYQSEIPNDMHSFIQDRQGSISLDKCKKFFDFTHQPCFSISKLFGNHWMVLYYSFSIDETKRTLFRIQVDTHCVLLLLLLFRVVPYFRCRCYFVVRFSINSVYIFGLHSSPWLTFYLYTHNTYHETFTHK